MKKRISVVLAMVMMLSLFMFNTVAESAFASAKKLELGKTRTMYLENDEEHYIKVNAPSNGKIKISFTSYTMYTRIYVYDTNGKELSPTKNDAVSGEWYNHWSDSFTWNEINEKAQGNAEYNVKKGDTYIKVDNRNTGIHGDCAIKVTFTPNKGAVDAMLNVTLEKGETLQLGAALTPADSTSKVSWKSGDTEIVKVSSSGKITAVAKGTATITATVNGMKFYLGVKVRE